MQNKGINIKEVDVSYSRTEQNMSFFSHDFSQSRGDTSNGYAMHRNRIPNRRSPETDPWQGFYGGTSGDTTVDYRIKNNFGFKRRGGIKSGKLSRIG